MIVQLLLLLFVDYLPPVPQGYSCLPGNVKPADIVSAERTGAPRPKLVTVTVEQTMRQLRARCVRGKLVDGKGKEIRFYRMQCFGAPTEYAMETTRRQRVELEALRKRYTVVEMTCSPSGEPRP